MKRMNAAAAIFVATTMSAYASALEHPSGEVVLTVRGAISNGNAGARVARFDMDMLLALAGRRAVMETPWTRGMTRFDGPLLEAVLEAAGAHGDRLIVRSLDDTAAELPMADATEFRTILAAKLNDDFMPARDKGPLFLVYPFDTNPELYTEKYFARSIWQVVEIEVVD